MSGFPRVALGFLLVVGCSGGAPPRPDIVVVVLDTLRPDYLGFYGHPRENAPFLAELAERSAVFLDAVSTSGSTAPSTASLLTSLHPLRHGVLTGMFVHNIRRRTGTTPVVMLDRLRSDVETLPERLGRLGYRCFGVTANPNVGPEIGLSRGFDVFTRLERLPLETGPGSVPVVGRARMRWGDAEEIRDVVRVWRKEIQSSRPYFLYLHPNDIHEPYSMREGWYVDPGDPELRPAAAYESEIGYVDDVLRRIYRDLALERDAIVVVLSDHGEAFGEHGRRHHSRGLYRELNRIVMMVSAPSLGIEPRRIDERVSLLSVVPTLLDLLGEPLPADLDGLSLAPLLLGGREREALEKRLRERVLVAHREEMQAEVSPTWAVMKGRWTLIREADRSELYDVVADPGQLDDLAAEAPEVRAALESEIAALRLRVGDVEPEAVELEADVGAVEGLKALGYVVDE